MGLNSVLPGPTDVEVHETVLAAMRSLKAMDTAVDYVSPIVESPTKTGVTFRFNDQHDKADIDDEVGPYDASPIVESGVIKGTYSCKPHRRSEVLAAENMVQDDTGLFKGLVGKGTLISRALHLRRSRLVFSSLAALGNYTYKTDIGAVKKWGAPGSDPQDDVQKMIEDMALRLGLVEEEVMANLRFFAGASINRILKTKVIGTIQANAGISKMAADSAIAEYLGVPSYRAGFSSYNESKKAVKAAVRARLFPADQFTLFYAPPNPDVETPQFKCTVRFMNTDATGHPTFGGWRADTDDPPVSKAIGRDWYDNSTFDWAAATAGYNVV